MQPLLQDKVALVTGIGPGLGTAVCRLFASEGADIAMASRQTEPMEELAAEIEAMGRRAYHRATDITDPAACEALVAGATEALGRVDVCVNNAFHNSFPLMTVADADLDHWRSVFDVNLWGQLNVTRACLPQMRERRDGRIVMVNTMSTRAREATWGAYSTSKAALENATKVLARELGPDGIRVNSVLPGFIYSPVVEGYLQRMADERGVDYQQVYDETADLTALKYLPPAEEIARSVLFMASDLARPVTGASLDVNAGQWIGVG